MSSAPKGTKAASLILFVALFLSLHFYLKKESVKLSVSAATKIGQTVATFQGQTLDGLPFDFAATASSNKLTILNFWETWCGPCAIELPDLQKIYSLHKDGGLEVVAIYNNSGSESVEKMIQELSLTFKVVHDEDGSISKQFGIVAVPTTLVMDSSRKVLRSHQGLDLGLANFVASHFKGVGK